MEKFKQTAPLVITAIIVIAGLVFLARYSPHDSEYGSQTAALAGYVSAPFNMAATPTSATRIDITCTDTSFATEKKYKFERTKDNISWSSLNNVTGCGYTDSNATIGATYSYRVKVCDAYSACSSYSSPVSATIPATNPAAPQNLIASVTNQTSVRLTWRDASNNEADFKIDRRIGAAGLWKSLATSKVGVLFYDDTTVNTATNVYYYRVYARNSIGTSTYSSIVAAVDPSLLPLSPGDAITQAVSSKQINVRWTNPTPANAGFLIERSLDGTNFIRLATTTGDKIAFYDTSVGESTMYYYRITAFNSYATSSYISHVGSARTVSSVQGSPGCYTNFTLLGTKNGTGTSFSYTGTPKSIYGFRDSSVHPYNTDPIPGGGYTLKIYQSTYLLNQYNIGSGRVVLYDNFPLTEGEVQGGAYLSDTGIIRVTLPQDPRVTNIVIESTNGQVLAQMAVQAGMNASCVPPALIR